MAPDARADAAYPGPLVSVLMPTLHEERALPGTLDHVTALPGRWEVVVADGGSSDATVAIARAHPVGARVVHAHGGRAAQCNAAARTARGDVLVVLHADSRLPADAYASLAQAAREGAVGGNFALRFDGGGAFARVLGQVYRFQRRHGYYYGDSSVWVRREAFVRLGGHREIPIMDDYDFVRRMEGLGATLCLPGPALTSSRRWRAMGVPRTVLAWFAIRWLYAAGVSPERLVRLYRIVR